MKVGNNLPPKRIRATQPENIRDDVAQTELCIGAAPQAGADRHSREEKTGSVSSLRPNSRAANF